MNQRSKLRESLLINDRSEPDSRSMLHLSGLVPCLLPNGFFYDAPTDEAEKQQVEILPNSQRFHVFDTFYAYNIDFIHNL